MGLTVWWHPANIKGCGEQCRPEGLNYGQLPKGIALRFTGMKVRALRWRNIW